MDPAILTVSLLALLVPSLYLYTTSIVAGRLPVLRGRRICLLIAHPDDEAMFFAPAVLALTRPELGNHVKILCLSSGDAEGLGDVRRRELVESGLVLGLRKREDVFVVDNPTYVLAPLSFLSVELANLPPRSRSDFPDSMTTTWDAEKIASLLRDAFTQPQSPTTTKKTKSKSSEQATPQAATIDVLITFDDRGISSHPNHISLYHGARAFVSSLTSSSSSPSTSPVDLYTLTTVNVARKYAGVLDALTTLATGALATWRGGSRGVAGAGAAAEKKQHPVSLVFMHGFGRGGWATAREAMTKAHVSQMVWFRYGWITLSRYMFMNDLRLEEI